MSNLIHELRQGAYHCDDYRWRAADEITRLTARVQQLVAASLRVLEWAEPIAGDNRNGTEAEEEVASVEVLRAALSASQEATND